MASIFTKIIHDQISSFKIKEDDYFLAFLDVFPLVKGHTLVIPKVEVDNFFDLNEEYLGRIMTFAQPIARAIEKSFDCNRCGVAVIGLEVPHAHLHLAPINSANDLNFMNSKLEMTQEELKEVQKLITLHL